MSIHSLKNIHSTLYLAKHLLSYWGYNKPDKNLVLLRVVFWLEEIHNKQNRKYVNGGKEFRGKRSRRRYSCFWDATFLQRVMMGKSLGK